MSRERTRDRDCPGTPLGSLPYRDIAALYLHNLSDVLTSALIWAADVAFWAAFRAVFLVRCQGRACAALFALPGGVVRVTVPAGQKVLLCVPELGMLKWHPLSISSSPHEAVANNGGAFTLHVKALGD